MTTTGIAAGIAYFLLMWLWVWSFNQLWNMRCRINSLESAVFPDKGVEKNLDDTGQTSLFSYIKEEE